MEKHEKAYWLLGVIHFPNTEIFQRNDPSRLFILKTFAEEETHVTTVEHDGWVILPLDHSITDLHRSRFTYSGVFKIIQTVVSQDEPSPFPRLHPSTCGSDSMLRTPSLRSVWVKNNCGEQQRHMARWGLRHSRQTHVGTHMSRWTAERAHQKYTVSPKPLNQAQA